MKRTGVNVTAFITFFAVVVSLNSMVVKAAEDSSSVVSRTATAENETGYESSFLLGDYNRDGKLDLYCIKSNGTESHSVEVHVLNGADNFQSYLKETATALPGADLEYEFQLGDYNGDGILDLFCIKNSETDIGSAEVCILNGATQYRTFLQKTKLPLPEISYDYKFLLGDYNHDDKVDIYCIKKFGTDSHSTEVQILNGADNFQTFLLQTGTTLPETYSNFEFQLGDYNFDEIPDLYCIKKFGNGSNNTEVQILDGANAFQTVLENIITPLQPTYEDMPFLLGPGTFNMYCISKSNNESGKTEVQILGFQDEVKQLINNALGYAVQYRKPYGMKAIPYKYAGNTPEGGIDCSAFTKYVYSSVDINLPRTTDTQKKVGAAVALEDLEPGDLVFPTSGHVQIYIGNGQVVHSPHTGEVVKIAAVKKKIYAARRVLK